MKKVTVILVLILTLLLVSNSAFAGGNNITINGTINNNGGIISQQTTTINGTTTTNLTVSTGDNTVNFGSINKSGTGNITQMIIINGDNTTEVYCSNADYYNETYTDMATWDLYIEEGQNLIVGGDYLEDYINNYVDTKGIFRGYGPGDYTITIFGKGFVCVVNKEDAAREFNFQVFKWISYGLPFNVIDPGPIEGTDFSE